MTVFGHAVLFERQEEKTLRRRRLRCSGTDVDGSKSECHCMTVFGHAVLFERQEEKTLRRRRLRCSGTEPEHPPLVEARSMNDRLTRRYALQSIVSVASAITVQSSDLWAQDRNTAKSGAKKLPVSGEPHEDLVSFDELMIRFVQEHQVPGAALAVTRNSNLIYARGFGWANVESKRPVEPDSLFRIASVSKPITAVAVLQLVPASKLDDRVFDVLPAKDWLPQKFDTRLASITIRQLLQHTAGWDRDKSFDPISRPHQVAQVLQHKLPMGPKEVVRFSLTLPLDFDPGTRFAYSNIGYLLLGRLIEHLSGLGYEEYVQQHVLKPSGVTSMKLGRVWKGDLAKGEVHYYDVLRRQGPAVNGPKLNVKVPLVYGAENFEAFEAHGGWIASAVDLVKFASAFDDPGSSKLLKLDQITEMWACPAGAAGHEPAGQQKAAYYGCGWNVRPVGNQGRANTWHGGLIAGTSSLLVRRHDGLNWAVLFNTDRDQKEKVLSDLIDPLVHQAADAVRHWPDRIVTISEKK